MKKTALIILILLISCKEKKEENHLYKHYKSICNVLNNVSFSFSEAPDYQLNEINNYLKKESKDYSLYEIEYLRGLLIDNCPSFLNYHISVAKKNDESEGFYNTEEFWNMFLNEVTPIKKWSIEEKRMFLDVCFDALEFEIDDHENLCRCSINIISKRVSADYFYSLDKNLQARLSGKVSGIYCKTNAFF